MATSAIAGVLCLGLFVVQVVTSVLRRDPGGLGRAVKGLFIALVASVFALALTRLLLGAVDALSAGVVRYAMDTNMQGLGRQLGLVSIASTTNNPAVVLLISIVVLAAVVVVWAAMMIRKLMIIVAAVMTPLAFSGATADVTRGWVRRWIEFTAAMIASKLLLVIILMVGVSVLEGAGRVTGAGLGQDVTQLATGALLLLMGGFAPWIAIKMFHFAGDSLQAAHAYAAQAPTGARSVIAAPQKVNSDALAGVVGDREALPAPVGHTHEAEDQQRAARQSVSAAAVLPGRRPAWPQRAALRRVGSPAPVQAAQRPPVLREQPPHRCSSPRAPSTPPTKPARPPREPPRRRHRHPPPDRPQRPPKKPS